MYSPFISVIIPFYNRAKYLPKVLQSLQEQIFQDFEVILVDDCSTDEYIGVISPWLDERTTILRNDKNLERCISRNRGIAEAKGQYITFIDSDDYHLPEHFQTVYSEIHTREYPRALFFTNAWDENEFGARSERLCPELKAFNFFHYILTYTFNPQRVAIHRDILSEFQFDPAIPGLEDLDLWLRIATRYPIYQIPIRSTIYVNHAAAYSASKSKYIKELEFFRYIFSKKELKGLLPKQSKSRLLSMCHYHIAVSAFENDADTQFWANAVRSLALFPKGYNGKTLKPLLVMMLYSIPVFGLLLRFSVIKIKGSA